MAAQLAPYNNAMRLGQGFNSYTQQICLTDAVLPPEQGAGATKDDDLSENIQGISQIVSYSSRFVDKLSDVTEAMNISASLSIKTATIGGKASGSFVDSDKFKESDINFFIQVKVTNQTIMAKDYTEFQKISNLKPADFDKIYGDTFISGWEQGGELNALISVKVSDKAKTFAVRAELEASLGTPALSGEVKGKVDLEKSAINTSTETTVTVNWSGGGSIKPPEVLWDVNSLTLAAASFPDMVSRTPQRTYAILTKYNALKSFHAAMPGHSLLDYENAGIYTSALLDSYMDYKSIWKQIQLASFELSNQRADMKEARPSKEILDMKPSTQSSLPDSNLQSSVTSASPSDSSASTALVTSSDGESANPSFDQAKSKRPFRANVISFQPYAATVLGLDRARRDCRLEMIKIVHEVDQVTVDPLLALDPDRDALFVSPAVFRRLLPIVTLRPSTLVPGVFEDTLPQVILGVAYEEEVESRLYVPAIIDGQPDKLWPSAEKLANELKHKNRDFKMGPNWAGSTIAKNESIDFNDLHIIDTSYVPFTVAIWYNEKHITGIKTMYTNGREIAHGNCSGTSTTFSLGSLANTRIIAVKAASSFVQDRNRVDRFGITDSRGVTQIHNCSARTDTGGLTLVPPTGGSRSFRGFFGSLLSVGDTSSFETLGCIWARESPLLPLQITESPASVTQFCLGSEGYPSIVQSSITLHQHKIQDFRMGALAGDKSNIDTSGFFNCLDTIDRTWRISEIDICYFEFMISGLIVKYTNGREFRYGRPDKAGEHDRYGIDQSPDSIVVTKIGSGRKTSQSPIAIDYLVFGAFKTNRRGELRDDLYSGMRVEICSDRSSGSSDHEDTYSKPPDFTGWSIRGFYGQANSEQLVRLGPVWGKD